MKTGLLLASSGASLVLLASSCAESTSPLEPAPLDPSTLTDGGSGDPTDAAGDADCDDDGGPCTSTRTCETADFCPTAMPIDGRYVLTAIWGSSKDDVWAVGSNGHIVHSDGSSWANIPSGIASTLRAIGGHGSDDLWIVSTRSEIYRSGGLANGALVWAPRPPPVAAFDFDWRSDILLNAISVGGADDVWVAGEPVWTSGSCFNRWRARLDGTSVTSWDRFSERACDDYGSTTIYGMNRVGSEELWAVGGGSASPSEPLVGRTFRMKLGVSETDGGVPAWEELDSQADAPLLALWGTPEGGTWAVGEKGTIRHHPPGAVRWSIVSSPTGETLRAVWGSAPNDVWAAGDRSTIVHFDGEKWSLATAATMTKSNLHGIWGSSANDVWIVGEGLVLHGVGKKP